MLNSSIALSDLKELNILNPMMLEKKKEVEK
jgi:hypothetical protein